MTNADQDIEHIKVSTKLFKKTNSTELMDKIINNKKSLAKISGLLYLVTVLTGIFSLGYVPNKLIVWKDAAQTFNNIVYNEFLFRLGIYSSIICYVAFLFLPLFLYKLLEPINRFYAKCMVILAIVSVPISLISLQNEFSVLSFIGNNNYLSIYGTEQLQSLTMIYLKQYNNGILIASVFWGLWLFPFGYLVYKSKFLPKILGVFLILGCFGYLINFSGFTLFKNYSELGIAKFITIPGSIGEIGTCLWLLFISVKKINK